MRSSFDLKHNLAKITPETKEDLEILKEVITPGSLVKAKTPRSVKIKRNERIIRAKTGRREVLLKIEVEKVELRENLRLTGKIIEAPEDVEKGYHTIEVKPGKFLVVEKEWKGWEVDRVKSAERKVEPVLICILDEREADFYILKEKYKHVLHISSEAFGKGIEMKKVEKKIKEYYDEILKEIRKKGKNVKKIIIAGPGFAKENLKKLMKEREKELLEKVIVEHTFHSGNLGLQELLRKGLIEKLTKMSRVAEETKVVEEMLTRIGKNGNAVYGPEKTEEVLNQGKVKLLLVSDKRIREFEKILDIADKMKCKIMVISSEHEAGEKFLSLSGIGALL